MLVREKDSLTLENSLQLLNSSRNKLKKKRLIKSQRRNLQNPQLTMSLRNSQLSLKKKWPQLMIKYLRGNQANQSKRKQTRCQRERPLSPKKKKRRHLVRESSLKLNKKKLGLQLW